MTIAPRDSRNHLSDSLPSLRPSPVMTITTTMHKTPATRSAVRLSCHKSRFMTTVTSSPMLESMADSENGPQASEARYSALVST